MLLVMQPYDLFKLFDLCEIISLCLNVAFVLFCQLFILRLELVFFSVQFLIFCLLLLKLQRQLLNLRKFTRCGSTKLRGCASRLRCGCPSECNLWLHWNIWLSGKLVLRLWLGESRLCRSLRCCTMSDIWLNRFQLCLCGFDSVNRLCRRYD